MDVIKSVTDVPLRNCYCEFWQTYALHVLWTHYHDIDEGALFYSLFTTLVKSVFLLCGAFLSNSICFVVHNRLSRCLVARLSHGSKVLCLSRTFLVCCKWKRPNEELFVGGGVAKTSKYSGGPHLKNTEIVLELLWVRKYHISSNWFISKLYLDSLIFLAYVINV